MFHFYKFIICQFRLEDIQNNLSRLYQISHEGQGCLIENKKIVKVAINFLIDKTEELNPPPPGLQDIKQVQSIPDNRPNNNINNKIDTKHLKLLNLNLILKQLILPLGSLGDQ